MADSFRLGTHESSPGRKSPSSHSDFAPTTLVPELLERSPVTAAPLPIQAWSEASLAVPRSLEVQLDWEDLSCFEIVNHQFRQHGVIFDNAIALYPSNPAFPPRSGRTVLMGAPQYGWIGAKFLDPVTFVGGFITSSRRTVLSAYDHNDQLVGEVELTAANLANSNSSLPANAELFISAHNIHRVVFSALGGHLTLDDFSFSRF